MSLQWKIVAGLIFALGGAGPLEAGVVVMHVFTTGMSHSTQRAQLVGSIPEPKQLLFAAASASMLASYSKVAVLEGPEFLDLLPARPWEGARVARVNTHLTSHTLPAEISILGALTRQLGLKQGQFAQATLSHFWDDSGKNADPEGVPHAQFEQVIRIALSKPTPELRRETLRQFLIENPMLSKLQQAEARYLLEQ